MATRKPRTAASSAALTKRRTNKTLNDMKQYLDDLPSHERTMVEGMLRSYAYFDAKEKECADHIDKEGIVVTTEKGQKENPYVGPLTKFANQKSSSFTKVMRILKNSLDGEDDKDELLEFIKGK